MNKEITVCVCGGGNGSHVTAGYIGSKKGFKVNVLTRKPEKWIEGTKANGGLKVWIRKCEEEKLHPIIGKLNKISDKPEEVAKDADVFILGGPGHANPVYVKKIAPFVKKGAMIGALYGQGGFDWAVFSTFKEQFDKLGLTMFGLLHIPWICKAFKYGSECKMIGPKNYLQVTAYPKKNFDAVKKHVESFFDIPVKQVPNFLNLTMVPSNQIIHPARYYGIFGDWDGKKKYDGDKIPPLYAGLDQKSADLLQELSDELLSIRDAILKQYPTLELPEVKDMGKRVVEQYGKDVTDRTSLKTIFCSNKGYAGCATPTLPHFSGEKGKVMPNMGTRFTSEDVPFGLCILHNLGELAGVKTPKIDFYIRWYQQWMNKVFLMENGKLNPKLIPETGAPIRYGFDTLEKVVKPYL